MATNRVQSRGRYLTLGTATGLTSGTPYCVGQISGVIQSDVGTVSPYTGVLDTEGVYTLLVDGIDGDGNSAVAVGDIIYWVTANTPKLSKVATGVRFGYALGAVSSGVHTTSIPVKLGFS
jgi:hypothetical protein